MSVYLAQMQTMPIATMSAAKQGTVICKHWVLTPTDRDRDRYPRCNLLEVVIINRVEIVRDGQVVVVLGQEAVPGLQILAHSLHDGCKGKSLVYLV